MRSTDGIKKISENLGYKTEDMKRGLLSLDPVSPMISVKHKSAKKQVSTSMTETPNFIISDLTPL